MADLTLNANQTYSTAAGAIGPVRSLVQADGNLLGGSWVSAPTVTRPANATAYTAGDVVGGAITFSAVGPAGGRSVRVNTASLRINVAAVPSGMTTFRLYLYSVTPPSAIADNSPFDLPSGDRASFLGYVDLGTPADLGATLYSQTQPEVHLPLAGADVYGYLVTAGGFTPAGNSEVYVPTLRTSAL